MAPKPEPRARDPDATRARILAAAKVEFARKGLGGARVDDIALRAKANKRMLYHYFGNKEELFRLAIEGAYGDFRRAEAALDLNRLDPIAAVETLVGFNWRYFLANPEFLTLVNSENLHKARHIRNSETMRDMSRAFVGRMSALLERGVAAGLFRGGLDAVQVTISIASVAYYYLTNRFTGAIIYERDLMNEVALAARLKFNIDSVLRIICTAETLAKLEAQA